MKEATGLRKFKEWVTGKKDEVDYMLFRPLVDEKMLIQKSYQLENGEMVKISFATNSDLDAIIQIQEACYNGQAPWGRAAVQSELRKRTSFFLISYHVGLPIAFIGISLRPQSVHVTNIATIPPYQKQGLATFLILLAANIGKKLDRTLMTLEVRMSNEGAKRLYRKIGFEDGKIKKNYYHNNGEDALDMELNLDKVDEYNEYLQIK